VIFSKCHKLYTDLIIFNSIIQQSFYLKNFLKQSFFIIETKQNIIFVSGIISGLLILKPEGILKQNVAFFTFELIY